MIALHNVEARWVQEAAKKDYALAASHYADDGVLILPGAPPIKGKEALLEGWKTMVADPNFKLAFEASRVEVAKSGDMAVTSGSFTLTMTDAKTKQPVTDHGAYVTVYKKQGNGEWKAILDINTPTPVQ